MGARVTALRHAGRGGWPGARLGLRLALGLLLLLAGRAEAGVAMNQLCTAAGYGPGCIRAVRPGTTTLKSAAGTPAASSAGGLLGGMVATIVGQVLLDAVLDGPAPSAAGPAGDPAAAAQAQALRQAVERQRQLEQERENQLLSRLLDAPAHRLADGTQGLDFLENLKAEAGRPFDGNLALFPGGDWQALHDAWYSPEAPGGGTGASPAPLGEARLDLTPANRHALACSGGLCPFPRIDQPVVTITRLAPVRPPLPSGAPAAAPAPRPELAAELREAKDRLYWSAAKRSRELGAKLADPATLVTTIVSGVTSWGERGILGGLQREVAAWGRDTYQAMVGNLLAQTFDVLSDAAAGRWQTALDKSDQIGERWAEGLKEYRLVRCSLNGDARGAGGVAGEAVGDEAGKVAGDLAQEGLLRPVGRGAAAVRAQMDHWLLGSGL